MAGCRIPLYGELKVAVLAWLVLPATKVWLPFRLLSVHVDTSESQQESVGAGGSVGVRGAPGPCRSAHPH